MKKLAILALGVFALTIIGCAPTELAWKKNTGEANTIHDIKWAVVDGDADQKWNTSESEAIADGEKTEFKEVNKMSGEALCVDQDGAEQQINDGAITLNEGSSELIEITVLQAK